MLLQVLPEICLCWYADSLIKYYGVNNVNNITCPRQGVNSLFIYFYLILLVKGFFVLLLSE